MLLNACVGKKKNNEKKYIHKQNEHAAKVNKETIKTNLVCCAGTEDVKKTVHECVCVCVYTEIMNDRQKCSIPVIYTHVVSCILAERKFLRQRSAFFVSRFGAIFFLSLSHFQQTYFHEM